VEALHQIPLNLSPPGSKLARVSTALRLYEEKSCM